MLKPTLLAKSLHSLISGWQQPRVLAKHRLVREEPLILSPVHALGKSARRRLAMPRIRVAAQVIPLRNAVEGHNVLFNAAVRLEERRGRVHECTDVRGVGVEWGHNAQRGDKAVLCSCGKDFIVNGRRRCARVLWVVWQHNHALAPAPFQRLQRTCHTRLTVPEPCVNACVCVFVLVVCVCVCVLVSVCVCVCVLMCVHWCRTYRMPNSTTNWGPRCSCADCEKRRVW